MRPNDYEHLLQRIIREPEHGADWDEAELEPRQAEEARLIAATATTIERHESELREALEPDVDSLNARLAIELERVAPPPPRGRFQPLAALAQLREDFAAWLLLRFDIKVDEIPLRHRTYDRGGGWSAVWVSALALALIALPIALFFAPDSPEGDATAPIPIITKERARIMDYSPEVRLALAPATSCEKIDDRTLSLSQGELWLDVQKGGEGFVIDTSHGRVSVTGTQFGVTRRADTLLVDVSEGGVEIELPTTRVVALAGMVCEVSADGVPTLRPRDTTFDSPVWVEALKRDLDDRRSENLILHYRFDEPSGSIYLIDSSRTQNHVDLSNLPSVPTRGAPSVKTELFGSCARFDASREQAIEIGNVAGIDRFNQDFTVMAWVKRDASVDPFARVLSTNRRSWRFGFHENQVQIGLDTRFTSVEGPGVPLDPATLEQWMHLAFVFHVDSRLADLYVNGERVGGQTLPESAVRQAVSTKTWHIGRSAQHIKPQQAPIEYFSGSLDELRIYGVALDREGVRRASRIDLLRSTN